MGTLETTNYALNRKLNFEQVFRPIYYFSRFAGVWPFSIIRNSNGNDRMAHCGPYDVLWLIVVLCFNLALALNAYEQLREEQAKHVVHIRFIVESIFEMGSFLFITIGIVLDLINRNRLVDILKKFNAFDHEVSSALFFKDFLFLQIEIQNWVFAPQQNRYQNFTFISITSAIINELGYIS